jgi:putative ABC transport system substrate-binding protein
MISRILRSVALAGCVVAAPINADAQPPGKVSRVGFLAGSSPTAPWRTGAAFERGLRDLGWVEGQNVAIEYRFAEGRYDRLPDLAAQLVRSKVDVIVVLGNAPAMAASAATTAIPIVMVSVAEPVKLGLVDSLARPGGNVTGITDAAGAPVAGKRLELLMESVPNVRRVAILSNVANPITATALETLKGAVPPTRVRLQFLGVRGANEFDAAFRAMGKERAGAVMVITEAMFTPHRARLAELAATNRLPSMYQHREFVEAGGLMSYGASLSDLLRRAGFFVDKILKGAPPGGLPVEQPTRFDLVINARTAKTLGLTLPQSLLLQADQVID